jgi:tetratricopeptide (TPR) repeat protein
VEQGIDPFTMLGKALLLSPLTEKFEDRESALSSLATDSQMPEVAAYASFYLGNLYKKENQPAKAEEAYLSVTCLYPSGSLILNAAAELQAADLLAARGRHEEALAIVNSAARDCTGTALVAEVEKRLESLK